MHLKLSLRDEVASLDGCVTKCKCVYNFDYVLLDVNDLREMLDE